VLDGTLASIQAQYATDTLRIRCDGGAAACANLPGVEFVNDFGQLHELRMARDCDPQRVLRELLTRTRVSSFEIVRPSLHDIFVRLAGPEQPEPQHA